MSEWDILIALSVIINIFFFLIFQKLHSFWSVQGGSNFFMQQMKAAFNRIKNPKLVIGANSSRFAPVSFIGDNEPIFPDPTNKIGLPLQFEPKNIYHGARGIPVIFAYQGALQNVNPLEQANDDVELAQAAQTTEKFIQVEVERRYSKDNPFQKLSKLFLLHGIVMVMGFIILGAILMNIQAVAQGLGETISKYTPIAEDFLANPAKYGIDPIKLIPSPPSNASPPPGLSGGLIPGV